MKKVANYMIVMAALLYICGPATAASITLKPSQDQNVQNVWVDTPLTQVFRDISTQTDTVITACPHVPDQLVSLDVGDGKTTEECLKDLVSGRGLTVFKKNEKFFLVSCGSPTCPSFIEIANSQRIYLKYLSAKGLMTALPKPVQPYVSSGERGNEVLIYAPASMTDSIKTIIDKLDTAQQQVVLEVLVIELDDNGSEEFGLDWAYQDSHNAFAMNEGLGHFTGLGRYTSVPKSELTSMMVTLRSLIAKEKASIRSRPRVATLNGQPASVEMMLDEYFTIVTDVYNSTAVLRTELQVIKSGVQLNIIPNIGDDGNITVDVITEVSDVAARQNQIQGNMSGDLPIVKRRKANTKVRVKDGDAIVIGGLVEAQEKSLDKRVPVLSSIPLIGGLFTSKTKATINKEVVIFITPRIMQENETPLANRNNKINVQKELAQLKASNDNQPDPNAQASQSSHGEPNAVAAAQPKADPNQADGSKKANVQEKLVQHAAVDDKTSSDPNTLTPHLSHDDQNTATASQSAADPNQDAVGMQQFSFSDWPDQGTEKMVALKDGLPNEQNECN